MSWAEAVARETEGTFNCTSSRKPLISAIAAELQRVADECAGVADREAKLYVSAAVGKRLIAERIAHNIRARFPKEGA